jgi:hypothetical protein
VATVAPSADSAMAMAMARAVWFVVGFMAVRPFASGSGARRPCGEGRRVSTTPRAQARPLPRRHFDHARSDRRLYEP